MVPIYELIKTVTHVIRLYGLYQDLILIVFKLNYNVFLFSVLEYA